MTRHLLLVADDYGISPSVNGAILDLLETGRLSGTGCMTGFPEWEESVGRLKPFLDKAAIGLHLTLTDQMALTGPSSLAPDGRLPRLSALAAPIGRAIREPDIFVELDAQLARFTQALGRPPDYIDGHQHVHFLKPVRRWLLDRFGSAEGKPALRGAPALATGRAGMKALAVRAMALGFDTAMTRAGFAMLRPLDGIYDLTDPPAFETLIGRAVTTMPEDGVFMCHPGRVDACLKARDPLQATRQVELEYLSSDRFSALLAKADCVVRRGL